MTLKFREIDQKYADIMRHVEQNIAEAKKEGDMFKIQFYALLLEALRDSHFGSGIAMTFLEMQAAQTSPIPPDVKAVLCNNCDGTFVYCMCARRSDRHLHCIRCNGTMDAEVDDRVKHGPF